MVWDSEECKLGLQIWIAIDEGLGNSGAYSPALKLGKSTPNCMVYGETGTLPLQHKIEKRILSFWIKISEDKDSKIAKNKPEIVSHKSQNRLIISKI